MKNDCIEIVDRIKSKKPVSCMAYLHVDKKSGLVNRDDRLFSRFSMIEFINHKSVVVTEAWHAPGFGVKSPCFVVGTSFQDELITKIQLIKH